MQYVPYATTKTQKNRKMRKGDRIKTFVTNKGLKKLAQKLAKAKRLEAQDEATRQAVLSERKANNATLG